METDRHTMWLPELLPELKSLLIFVAICSPGDIWKAWRGHPGDKRRDQSIRIKLGPQRPVTVPQCLCKTLSWVNGVHLRPSHWPECDIKALLGLDISTAVILSVISSVYLRQSAKVQVRVDIKSSINRQWTIGQLKVSIRGLCVFSDWEWCCAGERRLMIIICWNPEIPWLWDNC